MGLPTQRTPIANGLIERLDALPTPSPLAMRLLAAANDDASSARDLVEIIRMDSALTAKVIALCRRGPRGRQLDVGSLDRAVVLLGFGAVRSAALSVEFVACLGGASKSSAHGFDPVRFWRHALAKAIVAESAARLTKGGLSGRAFVVGLLQDLGALGLAQATPALFDAACEEAERSGQPLDHVASAQFGMSCAEAGSRLAARWNLPEEIQEAIRLRGLDAEAAQEPHRTIVLLGELADRTVRRRHIGGAGFGPGACPDAVARALGIESGKLAGALEGLFDDVAARGESLGISTTTSAAIALEAIERANQRLASMQASRGTSDVLDGLDAASDPIATLGVVVRSITRLSGQRERLLVVMQSGDANRPEVREFDAEGALLAGRLAGDGDADGSVAVRRWAELRAKGGRPGVLSLACRGVTIASIYRATGDVLGASALAQAPVALWAFALGSSMDRAAARQAAERSAEAMRALSIARDRLVRDRALASVGEIAAGLAHEINNPLTVVSGRAQLLRRHVTSDEGRSGLDEIIDAAERASALVGQLLRTVRPKRPIIRESHASEIISLALRFLPLSSRDLGSHQLSLNDTERTHSLTQRVIVEVDGAPTAPPSCLADPVQVADALAEVLQNALDAATESCVEVSAQSDSLNGRCMIHVRDVGPGFSDRALQHALDPFFSERRSGRGAGLGLAKAQSIVHACGGRLALKNHPDRGAIVSIELPAAGANQRLDDGRDERSEHWPPRREAA